MSAPLRVLLSDNGFLSVSAQFYEMGVSTRRPSTKNLRGSELQTDWTLSVSSHRCSISFSCFCCPTNPNGDPDTLEGRRFPSRPGGTVRFSQEKVHTEDSATSLLAKMSIGVKEKKSAMILKSQHQLWGGKQKAASERSFMAPRNVKKWFPFAFGAP